jgi:hypothetical protein
MWLVASIVAFLVFAVAGIVLGVGVAIALDRFTRGAVAGALAPKIWSGLTLAWWAVACFTAGFGFCLALRRSLALSQAPDDVDSPRLSGEPPATRRLVVYGQQAHHGPAFILGSRDALDALGRAAAAAASRPDGVAATPLFFPGDDEGFRVLAVRAENDAFFRELPLQYVADTAGGTMPEGQARMLVSAELQEAIGAAIRKTDDEET